MASIAQALLELGITEWSLSGEPTNETEFNAGFRKVVDGELSSDPNDFGVTWTEVQAKYDELVAEEPLKALREERNRRITETDWWASSDLTMTEEQIAYRQALRDITVDYTSLDDVVWPTKPE
jgi:hypothetical protein